MEVPGGSFKRSFDTDGDGDELFPASISSFVMDKFEVTVGRFRKFVAGYPLNKPKAGDGKTGLMPGETGWSTDWPMPAGADELTTQLKCPGATWEDPPTTGAEVEQRPINCVSFYLAYAFCIWDGGRLPTEAEWNYVAAGGNEQRVYPWNAPPDDSIEPANAVYYDDASPGGLPNLVGSKSCASSVVSCGDARWGQADLAGNVLEWNLDYYSDPYPTSSCDDCWNTSPQTSRVMRGGSYVNGAGDLISAERWNQSPTEATHSSGFRCVYDLKP
jgi:formylglycine-generating enzyme required for sulfatase activity